MAKAHTDERGMTLLLMDADEMDALACLLNIEAGDDGPLLDLLEALVPTWTQGRDVCRHGIPRSEEARFCTTCEDEAYATARDQHGA